MTARDSFGEHIRKLREDLGLPLRKVAAALDIDPSTLRISHNSNEINNLHVGKNSSFAYIKELVDSRLLLQVP